MLISSDFLHVQGTVQAAEGAGAPGGNMLFVLIMVVAMVVLLWLPARRQRKIQQELRARQESLQPGIAVMTNFGLFGTVQEVNQEQNYVLLQVASQTTVKIHLSTVTTIVDEEDGADSATHETVQDHFSEVSREDHTNR